jgi:hypothetical protein
MSSETVVDPSSEHETLNADVSLGQRAAALQSARDGAMGSLIRNSVLLAASLLLWAWTYINAVVSGGGVYIIAFGAAVVGGGNAVNAFIRLGRAKRALAALETQYGKEAIAAAVSGWADELLGEPEETSTADADAAAANDALAVGYVLLAFAAAVLLAIAYGAYLLFQATAASPGNSMLSTYSYALGMGALLGCILGFIGIRSVRAAKKKSTH